MPTMTTLPTAEARQKARDLAVKHAALVARQLLALGLLDHPKRDELLGRINSGELLPRLETRLSGTLPLLTMWADLADDMGPPVFVFCAGAESDLEAPDLEGKPQHPGSGRLN